MIQLGEVFLRLGSSSTMPPKYWLPRKTAGLTGFSSGFSEATNRGPVTSFIRIRSFLTGTGSNSLDGWGLVNYLFLPTVTHDHFRVSCECLEVLQPRMRAL